jgi:hypothetical protein
MSKQEKENLLPPIISQQIAKLNDPTASAFQKETACQILERVRNAADIAIADYKMRFMKRKATR